MCVALQAIPIYARGWWGGLVMVYLPTLLCGGWVLATVFAVSHNSHVTEYNLPRDMVHCAAHTRLPRSISRER